MQQKKKFKINIRFLQRFLPILIVLPIIITFFTVFMINNYNRVIQQNGEYVAETAQKTAIRVGSELSTASVTLMNIASLCEPLPDNDGYPENLKQINTAIFANVDYVSTNGTIYRYFKEENRVESQPAQTYAEYYTRGVDEGHTGVYAALRNDGFSNQDGTRVLNVYTPVTVGGETKGVLLGRFSEEKLRSFIDITFFNHPSEVFLYSVDFAESGSLQIGDIKLLISSDESVVQEGEGANDIYSRLNREKDQLISEIQKVYDAQQGGIMFNTETNEGVAAAYLTFVPGDNKVHPWLVLQTFPAAVTAGMTKVVNLEGVQLGLGLILALAVYIVFLIIINYIQNRRLVKDNRDKSYVVDALTQLYDRFVYVNLDAQTYRYVADTTPTDGNIVAEGAYADFRKSVVASFKDGYDRKWLSNKLAIAQIKQDLGNGNNEIRYEYRTADGQDGQNKNMWEEMSIICLSRNVDGKASEVLFARQNISALKERELQNQVVLKEALRAAEDANRAKSDFLSNMSHDIRTPMNAVIGFSSLLEEFAYNPEKVLEYSKKIKASGQHLLGLINDILDMSKIESGKITLNISEFTISELLEDINSVISPQARAKNLTYRFNTYELLHENYLGDKLRISQILINILSNAVKYTPEGGTIEFTVRAGGKSSDNIDGLKFTVKDNGVGMSEEFLKKVYEPFEREENDMIAKIQGTGLGMAITKNLVDLMGGTIDVQSKLNEGTTFSVGLQLRVVEQTDDGDFWRDYNIKRTLVVDDEEDICINVSDILKHAGVEADYCTDGNAAYKLVKQSVAEGKPYDVVLIDLKMPVLDGVETARLVSGELEGASVLILTAYDWENIESAASAAGVQGFMSKPFFISAFKRTIASIRSRVSTTEQKPVQGENPLEGMRFLVAEDNEINAEIIEELLAISGATCEIAQNGKIALEKFINSPVGAYDMILMDVQMPVMDGYAATRAIRSSKHPSAKTIPIAAMTANAFADDVKQALRSGMNAHIAKPISLEILKASVAQLKDERQRKEQPKKEQPKKEQPKKEQPKKSKKEPPEQPDSSDKNKK